MSGFTLAMLAGYATLRTITGICPHYEALESFDVERFKGVWYELQRDTSIMFETGDCVTAQYGDREQGGVSVQNTEFWPVENRNNQIDGFALANNWYPG